MWPKSDMYGLLVIAVWHGRSMVILQHTAARSFYNIYQVLANNIALSKKFKKRQFGIDPNAVVGGRTPASFSQGAVSHFLGPR